MSDKQIGNYQEADMWKRWEMTSFDAPAAPVRQAPAQKPAPKAADLYAEVKRLRSAAQLSGHAEGYARGHEQGLAAGTEEGLTAGHEQGYKAGYDAGHAAGRERAEQEAGQLQSLARACADSLASIEAEMGQALISLSIRIAEQVLRSTLDAHPEKILDLVRDITHLDSSKEAMLKLRVNPADLDLVDQYLQHDIGVNHWRLLADESIERGGCLAETVLGNIDATLQTRWQRVTSTLGHKLAGAKKA
ncbi:flagellar assembly protein FliH [Pollutimonas bauzanensis]|uniref:Flagellar assembly protein FliH n=1 Tax=Pollutimonas bauzanensis TaxID=658167 RepID=A0A1M5Z473_9BURK|nr:flagellar assembly protein FliH [Pollutimonas bauzanensis]SHI19009.1 flagellar assembly protein FliH [Pollutimonas bauzanensis]